MINGLTEVCNELRGQEGVLLLKFLSRIFEGTHDKLLLQQEYGEFILAKGLKLGLLEPYKNDSVILTSKGYMVGSVAKEYIHWINNNRQMPPPCPPDSFIQGKDVLDLGCSFGRWLWQFQKNAKSVIGIEMQQEYIELGRALADCEGISCPDIRQGSVEQLRSYVTNDSMDFVFIRLVLNHVFVEKTLRQIAEVLRRDGIIWAQVSSWSTPFREFLQTDKGRELRHKAFAVFGIVNSIIFSATNHQMSLKIQGRMHSVHKPVYPTMKSWKAALSRAGLNDFHVIGNDVFWARKD